MLTQQVLTTTPTPSLPPLKGWRLRIGDFIIAMFQKKFSLDFATPGTQNQARKKGKIEVAFVDVPQEFDIDVEGIPGIDNSGSFPVATDKPTTAVMPSKIVIKIKIYSITITITIE